MIFFAMAPKDSHASHERRVASPRATICRGTMKHIMCGTHVSMLGFSSCTSMATALPRFECFERAALADWPG